MSASRGQERLSRWRRRPERIRRDLGALGLLVALAVASALLLLPRGDDGLIGLPELSPGDTAPRTVKSSRRFSVIDPELTAQTRDRARASVRPVFDHLLGLAEGPKRRLAAAFEALEAETGIEDRAAALEDALSAEVPPAAVRAIAASDEPMAALDAASMLLDELFHLPMISEPGRLAARSEVTVRSIDADGLVTDEREVAVEEVRALGAHQARARVDAVGAERLEHLPEPVRRGVVMLVKALLTPNFVPNAQESLRRRRAAWISVKPSLVLVERGERIVAAGEQVTPRDLLLLRKLARLESPQARLRSSVGSAILGLLFAWLGFRVARHGYRHRHPKERDLVFLASAFASFLLLVWVGYKTVDWLAEVRPLADLSAENYRLMLPVAAVVIVVRLAAGVVVAASAAPVCAVLAGFMMDGSLSFAAYTLAGGLAVASTEQGAKRMVLASGFRAGLAQAVVVLGAAVLAPDPQLEALGLALPIALASGILAAALATVALPAVEALFGYTTPSGLASFADAEHPLMRDLLVEAPGTYHHSLHVGALADAGARAIGSDRLLARVGGYFHDVGRLRAASAGKVAPPAERRAAAAELALEHRFPPELAQILSEQPHEAARSPEPPGRPKPRSKASALVFLADRVEDALRGREGEIEDRGELEAVVREEVRRAVARRVLDDADLELRELAAVSQAFTDTLESRFVAPVDRGPGDFRFARPPAGAPS